MRYRDKKSLIADSNVLNGISEIKKILKKDFSTHIAILSLNQQVCDTLEDFDSQEKINFNEICQYVNHNRMRLLEYFDHNEVYFIGAVKDSVVSIIPLGLFNKDHFVIAAVQDKSIYKQNNKSFEEAVYRIQAVAQLTYKIMAESHTEVLRGRILSTIIGNLNAYVYVINKKTNQVLYANKKCKELFSHVRVGSICYRNFFGNKNSRCTFCPLERSNKEMNTDVYSESLQAWFQIQGTPIEWIDGTEAYMLCYTDVTKSKEYECKIYKLAYYDTLTGIRNKDYLSKDLDEILNRQDLVKGFIILIDINWFKITCQTFGKEFGDKLICEVSQYLVNQFPDCRVYRFYTDIFALILNNVDDEQMACMLTRIQERFSSSWLIDNFELNCTVHIGVAHYSNVNMRDSEDIINNANLALSEAKDTNNKQWVLFDTHLGEKIKRKFMVQSVLMDSIKNDGFYIMYQPIFSNEKNSFTKMEALIRMNTDKEVFISPSEFIPIAESTGMIIEIGMMVIEKVCSFIHMMKKEYHTIENICINVSPVQLMQLNFVDRVQEIIYRYKIDPKMLVFEITESVVINSFESVKQIIEILSKLGIQFALDDFGTGYSGLNYVMNLPFNYVKLDRSLISGIEDRTSNLSLVKNIIHMMHEFGVKTVAEGVETEKQRQMLFKSECDYIQGFIYSKPVREEHLSDVLSKMDNTKTFQYR